MKAFYQEGVLRLVPANAEENEFLHDLHTRVILTEHPTNIDDPIEACNRNEVNGGITLARKSRAVRMETRLR